jgi:hypothetical protein
MIVESLIEKLSHFSNSIQQFIRLIPKILSLLFVNTNKEWLYYSLYFPGNGIKKCKLDLIKADPRESTDFNYKDMIIDKKKAIHII